MQKNSVVGVTTLIGSTAFPLTLLLPLQTIDNLTNPKHNEHDQSETI
jgi:hypothetical protein